MSRREGRQGGRSESAAHFNRAKYYLKIEVKRCKSNDIKVGTHDGTSRRDQILVPATRFCSKNGQFTRCDWSLRLVAGTSRRD